MDETPSLSNLPVDLAARCLEFLPFDTVRGAKRGVKRVSRGMRSAARRALTRGRWRPIKQFAAASLSIKATMDAPDAVPAASIEQYQAAWALEPGQVFFEVANWHGLSTNIARPIARFLAIVEPSIQGLGRIVAACEAAYECDLPTSPTSYRELYPPGWWEYILTWAAKIGKEVGTWNLDGWNPAGELVLIGDGFEQWANATHAAEFFSEFLIDEGDHYACLEMCRGLSKHWRHRGKAREFVSVQEEATEEIQRQLDEDWEAEHGWKYGPSGDKFWEEEDSDYDSVGLPYH